MKKLFFVVIAALFLNGCFQVIALVGPAASGMASGNIYQSAFSYSVSYGVQKSTGKTIIENIIDIKKKSRNNTKMAKNKKNKELINSFYPRTYPQTLKSIIFTY